MWSNESISRLNGRSSGPSRSWDARKAKRAGLILLPSWSLASMEPLERPELFVAAATIFAPSQWACEVAIDLV